ncbi:glycerol-3-phosphate dehydrogenase subunit GlpB [Gallibacterium salpingitidis]|uniref:glycerol-3-phosphate dehydrogenase subunit GlpB n=1 Tax=Gallibacterium salpingitidis TaxID=505341 RepID=UPI00266FD888|nr:glycerol-3-phosphate dehydrogenase subunit GlpB [Gallibacterium salpingitidis]WKS99731.1 glycerol-3-phosphate dehydrogenase subunit GlpB [Gallibacterium salpingitidis]
MNFDTLIIGGGLAGLLCGIKLQQQGQHCAIITAGQSAIDFSSGSLDLLSYCNNEQVNNLKVGLQQLATQSATHPYSLLGADKVISYAEDFEQLAQQLQLPFQGSCQQNHYRITPLGSLQPAWLSPTNVPTLAMDDTMFAYRSVMVLGIEGFHDFQPHLVAANLKSLPQFADCDIQHGFLHIPELDHLRTNAREFRSVNISQALEHKLNFQQLVQEIKNAAGSAEAVFLPACFGIDDDSLFEQLKQATGLPLFELPTLPPSLLGLRQHYKLRREFQRLGGVLMNGDTALRGEFENGRVSKIYTALNEEIALSAKNYILASGSFFSNGLVAHFEKIIEPVFDLDLIADSDRLRWTAHRFADPQPYQYYGVKINAHCQVEKSGQIVPNLFAVGAVIGGFSGLNDGCGSGVSIVTAFNVADYILAGGQQ